ncbi:UNVERIFIED_ORG: hypothetical protein GGE64_002605 [Rhizobium etli]|nr:hypothetical protein EFR00_15245 [Rhizobium sophoriradicis]
MIEVAISTVLIAPQNIPSSLPEPAMPATTAMPDAVVSLRLIRMMVGRAKGGRILNNISAVPQKAFHKVFIVITPQLSSLRHRSLQAVIFNLRDRNHPSRPARNS